MTYPPDYFEKCRCGDIDAMHRHGLELGREEGMLRQLERHLAEEQNPGRTVMVGPQEAVLRTPLTINGRSLNDMPRLHVADCPKSERRESCTCNVAGDIIAIEAEARTEGHREGYMSRVQDELSDSGHPQVPHEVGP